MYAQLHPVGPKCMPRAIAPLLLAELHERYDDSWRAWIRDAFTNARGLPDLVVGRPSFVTS
jgi:hypothetical protein